MTQLKKLTGSGFAGQQAIAITGDIDAAVTALGTNAATAYAIGYGLTNVTTAVSGTGLILPPPLAGTGIGDYYEVNNAGANAALVYPPTGGTVNGAASQSVAAGGWTVFKCWSADGLTWKSK